MEVLVAYDQSMVEFHQSQHLTEYILSLMLTASNIIKDPSIGNPIILSVKDIIRMNDVDVKTSENGKCKNRLYFQSNVLAFNSLYF